MKKPVLFVLCAIVVVIALVVSILFVWGGKEDQNAPQLPDLTGYWTVAAVYANDTPTFVDNQFMTFQNGTASMYKDTIDQAYATSTYTVNEAAQLLLPDISREYKIDKKTDRCVRLYESPTQYMLLIKNKADSLTPAACTAEDLNGKWNVAMKGDQFNNGEVLEFTEGNLRYYKQGASEPFATAAFVLENGSIRAESLGMQMKCYATSDQSFALIEQSGIVWELVK